MKQQRFRVGIIGLQPGASWAALAHLPALQALPDDYQVVGVANTSLASAVSAALACGVPRAFSSAAELIGSPDIDVVVVAVKIPHHFDIVKMAIEAGKPVYCEWALGNGLAEASALADLARARGVLGVIGTQALVAPEFEYARQLVSEGYVGEVLSSTLIASGLAWGAQVDQRNTYLLDPSNGATMLTIPFGHTIAAVQNILGNIIEVSARLVNRRKSVQVVETNEVLPMTAPDQLIVDGLLTNGAPIAVHYRGGVSRGTGFLLEINGTDGDLQISGDHGHAQFAQLSISGGRGEDREVRPLDVPTSIDPEWPQHPVPRNVARLYAMMAQDLRSGTSTAPTFDYAVGLHRLIAAVEESAKAGGRVSIDSL
ncbi:Gfo/Idh/MocA family protein [Massilia niabensis]|uniref:Gfo/Idh/MocA family protein n=1 Tax=Massilia niabensis TaxID=544910 RepID=A0ABW0LBN6_9BURK